MDKIYIKDLMIRTIIGTREDERLNKQDVVINIVLWAELGKAGKSDAIGDTVNYRTINKKIVSMAESSQYHLVEALADRIADLCLEDEAVHKVEVRVEKPGALRFARSVGVEITRERH